MATYIVTGAAGFVGSHLSESLIAGGHSVIGVDCFTDYYPESWKLRNIAAIADDSAFRLVRLDLAQQPLDVLDEDAAGVFHVAAQPGVRASWGDGFQRYVKDNVVATQKVFEFAASRDIRVVYASSSSIYGDAEAYPTSEETPPRPISPYGVTKLTCESLAYAFGKHGLDAVGLRYFTVYGPRQRPDMAFTRVAKCLLRDEEFTLFGTGTQSRDVTYVGDAVAATRLAMNRGVTGRVYNVGGGSETSLAEAIGVFEHVSEKKLRIRYQDSAMGDVKRTVSDVGLLATDTSWRPAVTVENGITAHFEWAVQTML